MVTPCTLTLYVPARIVEVEGGSGQAVREGGVAAGVAAPAPKRYVPPQDASGVKRRHDQLISSKVKLHGTRESVPSDHGIDSVKAHEEIWWGVQVQGGC